MWKRCVGFILLFATILFLGSSTCKAQLISNGGVKWWNPELSEYPVLEGQAWPEEVKGFYDRLPEKSENYLREIVWQLSQHGAGLKIKFKTDASKIYVRYVVKDKNYAMSHFPATGVSGVDLYALNNDGSWDWADGLYSFGDTITYTFDNLGSDGIGRSFHLYLPLYNKVMWSEIGVAEQSYFEFQPPSNKKPIVVYGTSIAQGGCASRAGMAWTAILERNLHTPLVNLGFSGNAKMETEVIELLKDIDAEIFILDCLPNLHANTAELSLAVENKYIEGVLTLKEKYADTPILLTEHAGDIPNKLDKSRREAVVNLNRSLRRAYNKLKADGVQGVYLLESNEIGLGIESTVDGLHPTDLGMMQYARTYQNKIQEILKEMNTSTTKMK